MRLNWNLPVRSQILGLSLLLSHLGVEALEWRGPKATGVGTQSEEAALVTPGISPRPTVVAELVKRDAWPVSYCGFVGGLMCTFSIPVIALQVLHLASHSLLPLHIFPTN
jgi:hypothetical protein